MRLSTSPGITSGGTLESLDITLAYASWSSYVAICKAS